MPQAAEFVHEPRDILALNAVLAGRSRLGRVGSNLGALLIAGASAGRRR